MNDEKQRLAAEVGGHSGNVFGEGALHAEMVLTVFGGHAVPADGLCLLLPCGGGFTVWPNGEYAYAPGAGSEPGAVSVYCGYMAEDIDGSLVCGSFAVGGMGSGADAVDGFRAWSTDDVVSMESVLSIPGPHDDMLGAADTDNPQGGGGDSDTTMGAEALDSGSVMAMEQFAMSDCGCSMDTCQGSSHAALGFTDDHFGGGSLPSGDELDHMIKISHEG